MPDLPLNVLPTEPPSAATPPPRAPRTPAHRLWFGIKPWLLRVYRLAVVVAIVVIIQRHHARLRVDGDAPVSLAEVRAFFPSASRLLPDASDRLGLFVHDSSGSLLGYVLSTSPLSDKITGYAGPTDTLVAMDATMKVTGIAIRSSWDTKVHVEDVVNNEYFMQTWNGKTWEEVAGMEPQAAGIEGVSGASLTSMAIANGIHQRFKRATDAVASPPPVRFSAHDVGLVVIIVVAAIFAFTTLRSKRWLRFAFQIVLIGYVGFWNGQLLAQSLFAGWSASSAPWRMAPGLVLLAAAALIVPWTSRRALYCSQICPHGAAQELIGRLRLPKLKLPRGVERGLAWLPPALVLLVLIVTMLAIDFDLAQIEPFDAYLIRTAGLATIIIAVIGLIAAAFVPMAYCKYGCPTGFVLSYVRSHGKADRFTVRDVVAGLLVLATGALALAYDPFHQWLTQG